MVRAWQETVGLLLGRIIHLTHVLQTIKILFYSTLNNWKNNNGVPIQVVPTTACKTIAVFQITNFCVLQCTSCVVH